MNKTFAPNFGRTDKGWVIFPRDTEMRRKFFPYTEAGEHIAKANMAMVEQLVLYVSEPGEEILDPFAGTGTILIACAHERRVLMFELVDTFCSTIELNVIGMRHLVPAVDELSNLIPGNAASMLPIPDLCDHMIFCLAPETPVLTSDFTWKKLMNVNVGDHLIGVDEYPQPSYRKIRDTIVTNTHYEMRDSYRIELSDGRVIVASAEHPWLAYPSKGYVVPQWVSTQKLYEQTCKGHNPALRGFTNTTWKDTDPYASGYVGGFLDGEGYIHRGRIGVHQNNGPQLYKFSETLDTLGVEYTLKEDYNRGRASVDVNRLEDTMKLLGLTQPVRLIQNFLKDLDSTSFSGHNHKTHGLSLPVKKKITISSIEPIGKVGTVGIETTTKTFIAEGIISHNSPPYPMGLKKKGEMDKTSKDLGYNHAVQYSEDEQNNFTNMNDFIYHQKIEEFYKKCFQSIRVGGTMTVIIKDKMEKGQRIMQADRTLRDCLRIGFELVERNKWLARGGGYSAINRNAGLETVDDEDLITLRVPRPAGLLEMIGF